MPDKALLLGTEPQYQVNKCVRHLNIHSTSRNILCELDSYRNVTTGIPGYPSVRTLAKKLHLSVRTVQYHLSSLEKGGLLRRQFCFQIIEGGVARQTTSYYHLTKLTIGKTELTDQILALKLAKVLTPNKVRKIHQRGAAQGLPVHPPGATDCTPKNYISKNPPVPNIDKTPYINTTNIPGRDLSSIQSIGSILAETQSFIDEMPKVDPLKEAQAAKLLATYEQGMGMIGAAIKKRFVEAYVRSERDFEKDENIMKRLVTDEVFWKPTLTSPMRLFFAEAMLINKRRTEDRIRRGLIECENMGMGYERILMDDDVRRWFANDQQAARKAIEFCMRRNDAA